jgi:hypothetical protein
MTHIPYSTIPRQPAGVGVVDIVIITGKSRG